MRNANLYASLNPADDRWPIPTSLGRIYIRVEEMDVDSVGDALDRAGPREDELLLN